MHAGVPALAGSLVGPLGPGGVGRKAGYGAIVSFDWQPGLKPLLCFRLKGLLIYDVRLLIVLVKEANRGVFCRFSLLLWAAKE